MKSPKIRFKHHAGEEFPNWSSKKIGEILEIKHGKDYKNLPLGDIPVLGTGGIITYVSLFLCNWPCVLIGRKGTINKPQFMDKPFWSVDTLFYSKPKKHNSPRFQYYLFQTINWLKYSEATGVPSLSASTIENIAKSVPCLEEQEKIASFFSTLDQKIELNERKLEVLEKLKKGLMQKIFTREIRFKKEDGVDFPDWKIVSLGSVVKAKGGAGFPLRLQNEETNEVPFFKVSDLNKFENRMYLSLADKFISFETAKKEKYHYFNEKGVVLAKVGAALMLERKRIAIPPFLIDNNLMALFPNELININFLYFLCLHINFSSLSQVGAIPSISANKVERLNIELPSMEEQERISSFFVKLDERISLCRDKLETFKVLKKGLMQQMFA